MGSAALVLFASSVGVVFGWQPMPDGSPRYEYLVQLDPELVASLEEGQTIPISGEVPEEIRPIGRVRILVGRGSLPRQQLVTQFKPAPQDARKKSREGVIEAQYTVPPVERGVDGRYAQQTNNQGQILPPSGAAQPQNNGIARQLQNATQPARELASEILPPRGNLGITDSVQDTTEVIGDQFRNAGQAVRGDIQNLFGETGPVRDSLSQAERNARGAIQNLGQQARDAVDQFGRPLRDGTFISSGQSTQPQNNDSSSILPPADNRTPLVGERITPRGARVDQPIAESPRNNWQSTRGVDPILPGREGIAQSQPVADNRGASSRRTSPFAGFDNGNQPGSGRQDSRVSNQRAINRSPEREYNNQDRYATVPRETTILTQPSGSQAPRGTSQQDQTTDLRFPQKKSNPFTATENGDSNLRSFDYRNQPSTGSTTRQSPNPEIRSEMLDEPSNAPLEPVTSEFASIAADPPQAPAKESLFASDINQNLRNSAQSNDKPTQEEPKQLFLLVISWVLLSGSGVGNVYLFWSYLDVRSKYRGLVHNARSAANRFTSVD